MSSPLQGVRQGRPWEGRDRRQNNYADDDIVIFEEVLSHSIYVPERLPACRNAAGSPGCLADQRGCRTGIVVMALSQAPLMFNNDDLTVAVQLDPGYHVFSWCELNISLWGIEELDPPLYPIPRDQGFFTVATPDPSSYAWQALNPVMPGGNPSYEYKVEEEAPHRIACIYDRRQGAGGYSIFPHRVTMPPLQSIATFHHLYVTYEPIGGPLLSSIGGRIVDI
jgi:hypothetical protein